MRDCVPPSVSRARGKSDKIQWPAPEYDVWALGHELSFVLATASEHDASIRDVCSDGDQVAPTSDWMSANSRKWRLVTMQSVPLAALVIRKE